MIVKVLFSWIQMPSSNGVFGLNIGWIFAIHVFQTCYHLAGKGTSHIKFNWPESKVRKGKGEHGMHIYHKIRNNRECQLHKLSCQQLKLLIIDAYCSNLA